MPSINKPDSSRDLTILLILFISSFEIINALCFAKSKGHVTDSNTFLWIAVSVADSNAVIPMKLKQNTFS